jgi:hypothetical protein
MAESRRVLTGIVLTISTFKKGENMRSRILIGTMFFVCVILFCSGVSSAKTDEVVKPDPNYNFKTVDKIVIEPITSDNVDFGKVDPDRMAKIRAILEKVKEKLRKHMVEGAKLSKTTIPFFYKAPDKKETTLILKYNIEKFDNGNAVARLVPFAGKAKVDLRVQFLDAKNKKVVAEFIGSAKEKGGIIGGGSDAEVLWHATNMANVPIYRKLEKLTGFKYSMFSNFGENVKMGAGSEVDIMKEEKQEKDIMEKKKKNK